ncbi:hypothetical protein BOTBODRAFT_146567 [Botryobasidium botryosum FD-172 SS1]|uniref:Uncharacterized protein n=1 Tax=Botryobasidium botryosum (strain FD-172 SS1) TaxID=930990 RepID=A0A067MDM4_BOTB1|nr:hypothetical protein BOTBODRAFT_146567 [Botryobasidium botryosum FD-172 SS1]
MSVQPGTPKLHKDYPHFQEQSANAAKKSIDYRRRKSTIKTPHHHAELPASTSKTPSKRAAHSSHTRTPLGGRANTQESSSFGRSARRRATAVKRERREGYTPKARVSLPMPVVPRGYDVESAENYPSELLQELIELADTSADLVPDCEEIVEKAPVPEVKGVEVAAHI